MASVTVDEADVEDSAEPPACTASAWSVIQAFLDPELEPVKEAPHSRTSQEPRHEEKKTCDEPKTNKEAKVPLVAEYNGRKTGYWKEMIENRRRKKHQALETIMSSATDEAVTDQSQAGCLTDVLAPSPGTNSTSSMSDKPATDYGCLSDPALADSATPNRDEDTMASAAGDWFDISNYGCLQELWDPTPESPPETQQTPNVTKNEGSAQANEFRVVHTMNDGSEEGAKKKGPRKLLRGLWRRKKSSKNQ